MVLLLPGPEYGGDASWCVDSARNHAGFTVQSDGTAGKLYGDLGGSATGVTFVYVSFILGWRTEAALVEDGWWGANSQN